MPAPSLSLCSQQDGVEVDLPALQAVLDRALPHCLASPGSETPLLAGLDEVSLCLLDDEEMARVHGEFLGDPTPTDVITFQHGEILIGAETARREAAERRLPLLRELALYGVHGLLHLNGHVDSEPSAREAMHQIQEEILARVFSE